MATGPKSNVKVIFGTMTIGKPGVEGTRVHDIAAGEELLDTFLKHGHREVDSARVYGAGSTEEYLGQTNWQERGIIMETKLYPNARGNIINSPDVYSHSAEDVRRELLVSLKALKAENIDMFYLHGPDRTTPFEDTLREVNKLHQEGYFKRFGISNYYAWEVAKICEICDKNGWIRPAVYQGLYNAYHRVVEKELVPCLRHYGIALYCFNPLAGGMLTSRYHRDQQEFEKGSRFDPERLQGKLHRGRYWDELTFDALDLLRPVAQKHGISESECALRWLSHHSQLAKDLGDGVIIGASGTKHLEENLNALDQGRLPEDIVEALDAGWARIGGKDLKYWH